MRHGIILPTYVYNQERVRLRDAAFESLKNTISAWQCLDPGLYLLVRGEFPPKEMIEKLFPTFDVVAEQQPDNITGTEQTLAYGTEKLFSQGADYVTWMGDDALFHPLWLQKLYKLITDKPDAVAWSVYRSAYTRVHQTLKEEGDYVSVSSICGHGFTVSRKEWNTWGIKPEHGSWLSPYGDTMDMHHISVRPQPLERWVTKESWIEHTGLEGVHCTKDIPEHAVDFQKGEL